MQEASFVEALKKGDSIAFQQLIRDFQHKVVNTCYSFVHRKEEAEDLAQEVFIEVHQSIHRFRGEAKFSTWLYRIAISKGLDHQRKQGRQKRKGINEPIFSEQDPSAYIALKTDSDPASDLEQEERKQRLLSAIDQLPPNQKIAIILNKIEGQSYQEVAEIMDVSISSVESLLFRAKKNLYKYLKRFYEENMRS